ncbi:MAG TPA: polysaccharide deacetylase family protein [Chthoniobacteraceae bacterium]|jgi:peptidoglycan/xylan/chitin deacetylase (PgdA/CDA1 family)
MFASTPISLLRKIILGTNLASPPALALTGFANPWTIAAASLAHTAFAMSIMRPGCSWFGPVVTRFLPRGREVWLTIDDGPIPTETERLAEELRVLGARATFFLVGRKLEANPAIARQLLAAGHSVANHTQTHPAATFWALPPARLSAEIDDYNAALDQAGIPAPRWFRSPVGLKHTRLHPLLASRGMRLIAWSIRSGDSFATSPESVVRKVAAAVRPGAIILLHEGRPRSRETILAVATELQRQGFSCVIPDDSQLR